MLLLFHGCSILLLSFLLFCVVGSSKSLDVTSAPPKACLNMFVASYSSQLFVCLFGATAVVLSRAAAIPVVVLLSL